ncbi:MAG: hypothetical protein K0Q74_1171 [Gammaproteobacteria bacterium]|jgi:hypothetical protein|nr:hypothetical protein [Gammaproteobacteria bacterium]
MIIKKILFLLICIFSLSNIFSINAFAGSSCEEKKPNPAVLAAAGNRAILLKNTLDNLNPQVALIARVGSNMEKYNMHFTHAAFVVRDYPGYKGKWTVVHLLNQCGTGNSSIYAQGLLNFFADDLYSMDFKIIVPDKKLQTNLAAVLKSPLKLSLHNNHYSMLAYPFATRYQNSNQWILEVLVSANEGVRSREAIQQTLRESGFEPATIKVDGLTAIGAKMFKANVQFDDHPQTERNSGSYSVVSVKSLVSYLQQLGKIATVKDYLQ